MVTPWIPGGGGAGGGSGGGGDEWWRRGHGSKKGGHGGGSSSGGHLRKSGSSGAHWSSGSTGYGGANYTPAWSGYGVWDTLEGWGIAQPFLDGAHTFQHVGWDVQQMQDGMLYSPPTQEMMDALRSNIPPLAPLFEDLLMAFRAHSAPDLDHPNVPLRRGYSLNARIMRHLVATDAWKAMHARTAGDGYASRTAARGVMQQVLENLQDAIKEAMNQAGSAEQQIETHRKRAETLRYLAEQETDEAKAAALRAEADRMDAEADALEQLLQKAQAALDAMTDAEIQAMLSGARLQKTAKEVEDATQFGTMFGHKPGTQMGDGMQEGPDEAMLEKLKRSPALRDLAQRLGRLLPLMTAARGNRKRVPALRDAGVQTGRDIKNALAFDRSLLADEDAEMLFLLKFAQSQIRSHIVRGSAPTGRGPVIVMIDGSGSMGGRPWADAAAVGAALVWAAGEDGRNAAIVQWSTQVDRVDEFPAGPIAIDKLLRATEMHSGGGTDYNVWAEEAMRLAKADQYHDADVVVITDGEGYMATQMEKTFNAWSEETGTRVIGIIIGTSNKDSSEVESMAGLCHEIYATPHLGADTALLTRVFSV